MSIGVQGDVGLMLNNAAHSRAANYRQQAAQFRELAEDETNEKLRQNLLELANKYDELAINLRAA